MAHRLAYKINRFSLLNNYKCNNGRYQSTKIKVDKFPQNKTLTRSLTDTQQNVEGNIQKVSYSSQNGARSKQQQRQPTPGELRTFPKTPNTTEYCDPQVIATVPAGPQIEAPPRRRFEKSNTHNALTQPLKLPRLANPFPEPVKTLMSHTISDKEKQDLMFAEIKMERQFLEQQRREASMKQQELKYQQDLEKYQKQSQQSNFSTSQQDYYKPNENVTENSERDLDLYKPQQKKPDIGSTNKKMSVMDTFNTGKRFYSSFVKSRYCIQTDAPTPVQEAEMILNSLKSFYPEHELPKKSLFTPGSPEEKQFVEKTLQFLAKHKRMMHKSNAPFPSYSEVKTFVRRPSFKIDEADKTKKPIAGLDPTKPINTNNLWKRDYSTFIPKLNVRNYGTKIKCKKTKSRKCPTFKLPHCKPPHPEKCMRLVKSKKCRKLEAPYPAYTDCVESPYEAWPDECKICPWLTKGIDYSKINKKYSTYAGLQGVRHFTTGTRVMTFEKATRHFTTGSRLMTFKKVMKIRPKPCKNPAKYKPCNYVKTATKRDKIRSKYRGHSARPNYRKMKRDYSTTVEPVAGAPVAIKEPGSPVAIDCKAGCSGIDGCAGKVRSGKKRKGRKKRSKRSKRSKKSKRSKRSKKRSKKAKSNCRSERKKKKKCRIPRKRPLPSCRDLGAVHCGKSKSGCHN